MTTQDAIDRAEVLGLRQEVKTLQAQNGELIHSLGAMIDILLLEHNTHLLIRRATLSLWNASGRLGPWEECLTKWDFENGYAICRICQTRFSFSSNKYWHPVCPECRKRATS
jgi:hypothetical protein